MLKILDLYCGAGGASVGYSWAASQLNIKCHITGVDNRPQPNYPFDFVRGNAIQFLYEYGHLYDFIHGSPPCQKYSVSTPQRLKSTDHYPDLLQPTVKALRIIDKPFIVENVPPAIKNPDLKLNGIIFNLNVIRWRHFIAHRLMLLSPFTYKIRGKVSDGSACTVAGLRSGSKLSLVNCPPGISQNDYVSQWQFAMNISWMKFRREIKEAIPPDYSEFIGLQAFPQIISI